MIRRLVDSGLRSRLAIGLILAFVAGWVTGTNAGSGRRNGELQQAADRLKQTEVRAAEAEKSVRALGEQIGALEAEVKGYRNTVRAFENKTGLQVEDGCFELFQALGSGSGLAQECNVLNGRTVYVRGLPGQVADGDRFTLKAYRDGVYQYTSKDNRFRTVPRYTVWRAQIQPEAIEKD